jgi:hypothetical protein
LLFFAGFCSFSSAARFFSTVTRTAVTIAGISRVEAERA